MSLIAELKRRNVFRVGAAYAIVAWLLVEVASVVLPTFEAPEWVMQVFTFLVILGFPLALIFAWAFELTPEGIKPAKDVAPGESIRHLTGRKFDFAIIGLLAIAVVYFSVDKFVLQAEPERVEVAAEQVPAAEPIAREKSIAVLPFANISPDPEDAYFADGIHDEVLAQISKIRDLKVISRTSVMRYRGEDRPTSPEIAAALGVANILEGAALSPEEQDRLASVPTENLAAYEAYLLGRQRLVRYTAASLVEAVDYFEQAIELDPGFALAYVGLADSYANQVYWGNLAREEGLAKAQAAADKALALDDQLGEAYNSLAAIKGERGDLEGAEAMYRRALELNPNYTTAYNWYGELLRDHLGRYEEALALQRKAAELDPLSAPIISEVGAALHSLGQFDEALARYQRALEVDPVYAQAYTAIGRHYGFVSGRLDEAVVWYAKGISLDPGNPVYSAWLGWFFLELGDFDRAESWIERSLKLGPESLWPNFFMHGLYLYRGDKAGALDRARRVFALDPHFVPFTLRDHELSAGRYAEARALYEKSFPELLNEGDPTVTGSNWSEAIDLAPVLSKTGEQEHADLLLNRSFQHIQTLPRQGRFGYWIADVRIYALRGDKQKALSALRQAIDEGWRSPWRYFLKHDSALESLHDEPEYQAMVAEIEADMAAQLERVRELERNGELEPIPELSATTQ
jgi:tetratricopeptide (TPR) repeat protein